jgi:hypothetical protein
MLYGRNKIGCFSVLLSGAKVQHMCLERSIHTKESLRSETNFLANELNAGGNIK